MSNEPIVLQLLSSIHLGGQENLLLSLLEESTRRQQGSFVIVIMNTGINPIQQEKILQLGIPVYFLHRKEGHKHFKYLFSLLKIIRKHHVQLIHTHDFGTKYWGAACKLFCPSLKLVFTAHNTSPINRYPLLNRLLHRHLIDSNIVISETINALFTDHNIHNTFRIPNGIDIRKFNCPPRKSEPNILHLVNVARIVPGIKGQDTLIKALSLCKHHNIPFQCSFVGEVLPCHQQDLANLQKMAEQYGLSQYIYFTGPSSEIPALLKQYDLFILPSRKEAFGLAIIEAMACGIPVIASNIEGPAEIIQNDQNGMLFEVDNETELFNKIRFAYLHRETLFKMAQQAYHDSQSYSIEHTLSLHLQLYNNLAHRKSKQL